MNFCFNVRGIREFSNATGHVLLLFASSGTIVKRFITELGLILCL